MVAALRDHRGDRGREAAVILEQALHLVADLLERRVRALRRAARAPPASGGLGRDAIALRTRGIRPRREPRDDLVGVRAAAHGDAGAEDARSLGDAAFELAVAVACRRTD